MSDALAATPLPPWKTCLDFDAQDSGHYLDFVNETLYQGIHGNPGRVLDLGCSSGMFGKALKDRHPGTHVTGITHLRFFTLDDIRVMLDATGYEFESFGYTIASGIVNLFRENEGREKVTLQFGRMTLANLTQRELMEFCAETYVVRARPRP